MRHWQAVLLALLAGPLGGCFTPSSDRSTAQSAGRGMLEGPTGPDVLQLCVALIERPLEDPALNVKLWELVDEQSIRLERVVDPIHQGLLADNGFRIGQVAGSPPSALYEMLSSNRSCTNLRGISLHAGKPNDLYVGPTQAHCCFQLHRDGQATTINLDQAHCRLEVVPALGDNGRILLHFTPLVRHGEPTLATRPTQDPSGSRYWDRKVEQPSESYTWLSWDLSVAENEYVLVGCRPERGDTLGACCFLDTEAATPTQRLLVLRVGRGPEDVPPEDEAVARSAPLALQASWTAHSP